MALEGSLGRPARDRMAGRSRAAAPARVAGREPVTVIVGPEGGLTADERRPRGGRLSAREAGPAHAQIRDRGVGGGRRGDRRRMRGTMADCLFCKIVAGEIPVKMVKRSADALAFRDIDPKAPVHVLVIPTRHVPAVASQRARTVRRLLGGLLAFAAEVASELGWK